MFLTQTKLPFKLGNCGSYTHKYLQKSEFKPVRGHKKWAV
jgi:hypothetical protein